MRREYLSQLHAFEDLEETLVLGGLRETVGLNGKPFFALAVVLLEQDEGETDLFEFAVLVLHLHVLHILEQRFQGLFLVSHPPLRVLHFSKPRNADHCYSDQRVHELGKGEDGASFSCLFALLLVGPGEHVIELAVDDFQEDEVELTRADDLRVNFELFKEEHHVLEGLQQRLGRHFLREVELSSADLTL